MRNFNQQQILETIKMIKTFKTIDEQIEIALKKLEHIENVEKQISNILIRN